MYKISLLDVIVQTFKIIFANQCLSRAAAIAILKRCQAKYLPIALGLSRRNDPHYVYHNMSIGLHNAIEYLIETGQPNWPSFEKLAKNTTSEAKKHGEMTAKVVGEAFAEAGKWLFPFLNDEYFNF